MRASLYLGKTRDGGRARGSGAQARLRRSSAAQAFRRGQNGKLGSLEGFISLHVRSLSPYAGENIKMKDLLRRESL